MMEWLELAGILLAGIVGIFGVSLITHRFGMIGFIGAVAALLILGAVFS